MLDETKAGEEEVKEEEEEDETLEDNALGSDVEMLDECDEA